MEMRTMLVHLSNLLKPDEVKTMIFMCKDFIPMKKRAEIKTSIDLFNELEQRGKLKYDDVSFIEHLLKSACNGRTDVLDILSVYVQSTRKEIDTKTVQGQCLNYQKCDAKDLSDAFVCLEDNLGREYLMVLRRLGIEDHALERLIDENPRNVKEVIHKGLKLWHSSINCDGTCLDSVIAALKGEKRNDLAARLKMR